MNNFILNSLNILKHVHYLSFGTTKIQFLGTPHLKENIISESREHTWLHCGTSCLATRFCAAYNYKESLGQSEINCQLSHSVDHNFKEINYSKENDWTFYSIEGPRLVRISS